MTTISTTFSYQLGDTGVILNDDSQFEQTFVDIDTVTGLDNASYRETKRDHEGNEGGFIDAEFETGRDISLTGTIYFNGNSITTFLDSIKENWAPSKTLIPLYLLSDDPTDVRFVMVKPLGCKYNLDTAIRVGATNVQFNAYGEDPRIYGNNVQIVTIPVGAIVYTGFGFNLGFSFSFGGVSTTSDSKIISNGGNRPTPVVMTISGPVTNPYVYNNTTGNLMKFTYDLPVGQTLVIDSQYHTVRLNGTTNRRSALTLPGWFDLAKGDNDIRFRAEAGTGTLQVQSRDAWR